MRFRFHQSVALLALSAACADVPTASRSENASAVDISTAVVHRDARLLLLGSDPSSGYAIALGLTPNEIAVWCNTGSIAATPPRWREVIVSLPHGGAKYQDRGAEVPAVVYLGDPNPICTGAPIYAVGTAKVVANERFGESGAGGLHYTAVGTVTNAEDEVFRLHLTAHVTFLPNGEIQEHGPITLQPLE